MTWVPIASGVFASCPGEVEGPVRLVVGLPAIVAFMRDQCADQSIIVTNVAGGSAVSTIIRRAKAIVSTIGGPNSHIVVVARDYNVPCIVGAAAMDLTSLADGTTMRLRPDGTVEVQQPPGAKEISQAELRLLRLVAFAGAVQSISHITGLEGHNVELTLESLIKFGLVESDGVIAPTPAGIETLEYWYEYDRRALDNDTRAALLQEFRPLDRELKRVASAWQLAVSRDDWNGRMAAVEALTELHNNTVVFVERYGSTVPRFREFSRRLSCAQTRILDGETSFFVGVNVDSYHNIWSQFHEDLLRLLQTERDPND